ncbi:MmgE/PrpD family protein [Streptosporangium soli]|nr:MmgE/PrpD family protein [Streptosporangium sp. KLBMP 9127]
MNAAAVLADFVTSADVQDDAVITKAGQHLLDTLGAALAGSTTPAPGITGAGDAPLWGTPFTLTPRDAALLNGIAAHALELDDTGGCDHSGAVVVPAALACLSLIDREVSGTELLTAVVLGYDVARRVLEACGGYAAHNQSGWHSTGTCGTFGAAAAAARLLGLDPGQTASALGLASSFSSGLWAFVHDGATSKRLHAGRAAEGGLTAALLATRGITGPGQAFADVWGGFLTTFAGDAADPGALTRDLGTSWRISRCAIKPYSSCRSTHSSIDAIGRLLTTIRPEEIAMIKVRLSPLIADMCGGRILTSLPQAQMSLPYGVAARILYGKADLAAYAPERRADPRLADLLDRIVLDVDPAMSGTDEPELLLTTTDHQVHRARVTDPLGSPTNPLGEEELLTKFRGLAATVLPSADAVAHLVTHLDEAPDVRRLPGLLLT